MDEKNIQAQLPEEELDKVSGGADVPEQYPDWWKPRAYWTFRCKSCGNLIFRPDNSSLSFKTIEYGASEGHKYETGCPCVGLEVLNPYWEEDIKSIL